MDNTKKGIDVIAGVNESLKYRKENPKASEEKIMNHIMNFLKDRKFAETRLDVIVGVAHALKILERAPKTSDKEIIDRIMKDLETILPKED